MRGRDAIIVTVCGLAAATGAGVWVMSGGDAQPPTTPAALAQPQAEPEPPAAQPLPRQRREPRPAPAPEQPAPEAQAEAEAEPAPSAGDGDNRRGRWNREQVLERFDTDGDGQLSEEERDALREQMRDRRRSGDPAIRQIMMRRYDADGDGQLSETEREAARNDFREIRQGIAERIVPLYDLDGDGELNQQEREAAAPAFRAEFERLRAFALLDEDASGDVNNVELAKAISAVGTGDELMDLNRDGKIDYQDAAYAAEVATQSD